MAGKNPINRPLKASKNNDFVDVRTIAQRPQPEFNVNVLQGTNCSWTPAFYSISAWKETADVPTNATTMMARYSVCVLPDTNCLESSVWMKILARNIMGDARIFATTSKVTIRRKPTFCRTIKLISGRKVCSCPVGFLLRPNQRACKDINECRSNRGNCSHGCKNLPGSYECTCPHGFKLEPNNLTCIDVNECEVDNGGCEMHCRNYKGIGCKPKTTSCYREIFYRNVQVRLSRRSRASKGWEIVPQKWISTVPRFETTTEWRDELSGATTRLLPYRTIGHQM